MEEVNEMDGDSDLERDSWEGCKGEEDSKVEEVNGVDGDSDLERDSWKRG